MTLLAEWEESAVSKWVPHDGRLFPEFLTYSTELQHKQMRSLSLSRQQVSEHH